MQVDVSSMVWRQCKWADVYNLHCEVDVVIVMRCNCRNCIFGQVLHLPLVQIVDGGE